MHAFLPTAVAGFNWQASNTLTEQCLKKTTGLQIMFVNSLPEFEYNALSQNRQLQNDVILRSILIVRKSHETDKLKRKRKGRFRERMCLRDSGSFQINRAAPEKEWHPAAANRQMEKRPRIQKKSEWRNKCGQNCRVELVLFAFQKRREAVGFGNEQDPSESEWGLLPRVRGLFGGSEFFFFFCIFSENKDTILSWWSEMVPCSQLGITLSSQIKISCWVLKYIFFPSFSLKVNFKLET